MNRTTTSHSPTPCEEFEFAIMECVDGALAPEAKPALERHLVVCGRCSAFAAQLREVDADLAARLVPAEPSAGFDARLRERVATATRGLRNERALEREEQDYRAALRALRRGLGWSTALEAAALAAVVGGGWVAVAAVAGPVARSLGFATTTPMATNLALACLAVLAGSVLTGGRIFARR